MPLMGTGVPSMFRNGQVNAGRGYSNAINVGVETDVTANVNTQPLRRDQIKCRTGIRCQ